MTEKDLFGYYSWHMDELLELYNAMAGTDIQDAGLLHMDIEGGRVCVRAKGHGSFYINLDKT